MTSLDCLPLGGYSFKHLICKMGENSNVMQKLTVWEMSEKQNKLNAAAPLLTVKPSPEKLMDNLFSFGRKVTGMALSICLPTNMAVNYTPFHFRWSGLSYPPTAGDMQLVVHRHYARNGRRPQLNDFAACFDLQEQFSST